MHLFDPEKKRFLRKLHKKQLSKIKMHLFDQKDK